MPSPDPEPTNTEGCSVLGAPQRYATAPTARTIVEPRQPGREHPTRFEDAHAAWQQACTDGAVSIPEPTLYEDAHGRIVKAAISAYGETVHGFIQRDGYAGPFAPGFTATRRSIAHIVKPGLLFADHCAGNLGWGEMDSWGDFYADVSGFSHNEPAHGKKKSQIEEFLDFHRSAGVQHSAIRSDDIAATIRALKANGVEFLDTPDSYYDTLAERIGTIDEALPLLRELRILIDRDDAGYMLHILAKPLQDRPTVFFEIIQREGGLSFGKGNFKALFVWIENEQEKRDAL